MYEVIFSNGQRATVTQAVSNQISDAIAKDSKVPVIVKSGKNATYQIRPELVICVFPLK